MREGAILVLNLKNNLKKPKDFKNEELAGFKFPLVIKPINGYGSKGIFVVHSIGEIREKYDLVTCRSTMDEIQVESEEGKGTIVKMQKTIGKGRKIWTTQSL